MEQEILALISEIIAIAPEPEIIVSNSTESDTDLWSILSYAGPALLILLFFTLSRDV